MAKYFRMTYSSTRTPIFYRSEDNGDMYRIVGSSTEWTKMDYSYENISHMVTEVNEDYVLKSLLVKKFCK